MTMRHGILRIAILVLPICPVAFAQDKPCAPTTHAKLPVITTMPYPSARKALLANGWQPIQTQSNFPHKDDPIQAYWSIGYREVMACSGTGLAPCSFLFGDAYGNRLRVSTQGMNAPNASVSEYQFICK